MELSWTSPGAALKLPWSCSGTVLELPGATLQLPWSFPGPAPKLPRSYSGAALELYWTCSGAWDSLSLTPFRAHQQLWQNEPEGRACKHQAHPAVDAPGGPVLKRRRGSSSLPAGKLASSVQRVIQDGDPPWKELVDVEGKLHHSRQSQNAFTCTCKSGSFSLQPP